ncbi:RHS repeat domain-containing protein [Pseudomonas sp. PDM28]|uniref:RHS repeat domain-containing protein n=1 Tax=Pseudomonas sp. PDM28 TaxID=2854770 RepID=UPI00352996BC
MNAHHHAGTPALSVIDPRTLAVRSVGYCRHPDSPLIDPRITRQRFDAAGHLIESWDPRLWGTSTPNLTTVYGLSGQPLLTDSVDAGWQLSLPDQAGSPCSFWDARGSQRHTGFDEQQRPITVTEQAAGELPRVVERLTYGDSAPAFAEHNQCGQLIRHDDPAGTQIIPAYGLAGAVLVEDRRFLADLETPDWPLDLDERETWLEAQSFITRHTSTPGGALQRQIDAMGNVRTFGYDVAGKLSGAWLQMADSGKPPQCLVSDIRYNALDQVESETAGNGVVTRVEYAADDGRLLRLQAALGNQKPLQDLNYVHDPVGNIVELQDLAQPVTHFNNQRIDPINRYRYDSLYQLVEARGWEVSQPSHGPALPVLLPTPLDPNQRRNYTQRFEYDRGGNLITRQHSDTPRFSMFTSALSNRSLAQRGDGSLPGEGDIALGFDACGNQRELQRGQAMDWDIRNQLSRVTLVQRETEPDDYESYRYDRPGHRLRKVGFTQSSGRTLRTEVRYLPNLEIHRQADGEEHHVISVEAGRSSVRALHWLQGAHSDQLRYSLSDHLGSSTMELDDDAGVLIQEHYYPFGGTACWAGKSALVAQYKTLRYSGKERDATGLYYYGYRYYAPWLQRWVNPDPAGDIDGLNIFRFTKGNPTSGIDIDGLQYAESTLETAYPTSSAGGEFKIQRWGSDQEWRAIGAAFSDMTLLTNVPEIDMTEYVKSFDALTDFEKISIRLWAGVSTNHVYHDAASDAGYGDPINYEINIRLAKSLPLPSRVQAVYEDVQTGISRLPKYPATLLRTVEHGPLRLSPWGTNINIGDVVSNGPLLMAASESNNYAGFLTNTPALKDTTELAHYLIDSQTASPLVWNIASPSRNEGEWLFSPNSDFLVTEIVRVTRVKDAEGNSKEGLARTGVVLKEIKSKKGSVKNIFTGARIAR